MDEVFWTINGERQYLWRAVDQDGHVLDMLVQSRRNKTAAKKFFQTPPDLVVKFQPVDIVDVILWLILQPGVVYQREIKGWAAFTIWGHLSPTKSDGMWIFPQAAQGVDLCATGAHHRQAEKLWCREARDTAWSGAPPTPVPEQPRGEFPPAHAPARAADAGV
jgi:DDE superfamily endonuclease